MARGAFGALWELPRLQQIAAVFVRHGLGDLVRRAGIGTLYGRAGQVLRSREPLPESLRLQPQERLRLALEELGPTFVKLGQMLSTREDLLPPPWTAELEKLQTHAAPLPFEELLPHIEKALGRSPFEIFTELEREPYASASIAQVHRAKLKDGTPVVLKVRRPGIQPKVESDLRILGTIARLVEQEVPEARRYQPVRVVAEFRRTLEREIDLGVEARNIQRFAQNFASDPNIVIPKVYWDWTRSSLNVQEHIEGILGNDPNAVDAAGLDRKLLARRGAESELKMILVDGFFQADPHPGNVLYLPGNRIAMIDFGMVGRLSPARRMQIVELLAGVARHDDDATLDVLLDWIGEDAVVDEAHLAADIAELANEYTEMPLKDLRIGPLLHRMTAIMREHSIILPADLTLMFKALITLEGLGRHYDPDFRLVEHLKPFIDRAMGERFQPSSIARRGQAALGNFFGLLASLPRDLARLVKDARRGRMRVDLDLKRLDLFGRRLDSAINRITIGVVTASVVVGSSIVMTVHRGPTVFGMHVFTLLGLLGYVLAFFNSLWIILSIWRSNRN